MKPHYCQGFAVTIITDSNKARDGHGEKETRYEMDKKKSVYVFREWMNHIGIVGCDDVNGSYAKLVEENKMFK